MISHPSAVTFDTTSAPPITLPANSRRSDSRETQPIGADYLLVCDATSDSLVSGTWRFTLETADGQPVFTAEDRDCGDLNRLTLLAAVRGLESIDGPSNVTLLSHNRYLIRSLSDSLPRWRENDFVWEHFGRRIDVQHADLWRRIDRALAIHCVEAVLVSSRLVSRGSTPARSREGADGRRWRFDAAHDGIKRPRHAAPKSPPPRDQLRRWLIGHSDKESRPTARAVTPEHPAQAPEFAAPA